MDRRFTSIISYQQPCSYPRRKNTRDPQEAQLRDAIAATPAGCHRRCRLPTRHVSKLRHQTDFYDAEATPTAVASSRRHPTSAVSTNHRALSVLLQRCIFSLAGRRI
ncbi:hypothetical protein BD309DRAFT_426195 [Dichomitus squalens]|nr:hypothetical protein BD309DRAFT_426195 [Dichomitus squalens]